MRITAGLLLLVSVVAALTSCSSKQQEDASGGLRWQVNPNQISVHFEIGTEPSSSTIVNVHNISLRASAVSIRANRQWIHVNPVSGTIQPGSSMQVLVSLDNCLTAGTSSGTVTVSGEGSQTEVAVVRVCSAPSGSNHPPTASLSASPTSGTAPLTVSFTLSESDPDGDSLTCTLDFGDGSTRSGCSNTSHTYSSAGSYTARYTVRDPDGATASDTVTISVKPEAPRNVKNWTVNSPYAFSGSTIEDCQILYSWEGQYGPDPSYDVVAGPSNELHTINCVEWDSSAAQDYVIWVKTQSGNIQEYDRGGVEDVDNGKVYYKIAAASPLQFGIQAVVDGVTSDIAWSGYFTKTPTNYIALTLSVPGLGGYVIQDKTNTKTPITSNTRSIKYEWNNPWAGLQGEVLNRIIYFEAKSYYFGDKVWAPIDTIKYNELYSGNNTTIIDVPITTVDKPGWDTQTYYYHWRAFVKLILRDSIDRPTGVYISNIYRFTVDFDYSDDPQRWGKPILTSFHGVY